MSSPERFVFQTSPGPERESMPKSKGKDQRKYCKEFFSDQTSSQRDTVVHTTAETACEDVPVFPPESGDSEEKCCTTKFPLQCTSLYVNQKGWGNLNNFASRGRQHSQNPDLDHHRRASVYSPKGKQHRQREGGQREGGRSAGGRGEGGWMTDDGYHSSYPRPSKSQKRSHPNNVASSHHRSKSRHARHGATRRQDTPGAEVGEIPEAGHQQQEPVQQHQHQHQHQLRMGVKEVCHALRTWRALPRLPLVPIPPHLSSRISLALGSAPPRLAPSRSPSPSPSCSARSPSPQDSLHSDSGYAAAPSNSSPCPDCPPTSSTSADALRPTPEKEEEGATRDEGGREEGGGGGAGRSSKRSRRRGGGEGARGGGGYHVTERNGHYHGSSHGMSTLPLRDVMSWLSQCLLRLDKTHRINLPSVPLVTTDQRLSLLLPSLPPAGLLEFGADRWLPDDVARRILSLTASPRVLCLLPAVSRNWHRATALEEQGRESVWREQCVRRFAATERLFAPQLATWKLVYRHAQAFMEQLDGFTAAFVEGMHTRPRARARSRSGGHRLSLSLPTARLTLFVEAIPFFLCNRGKSNVVAGAELDSAVHGFLSHLEGGWQALQGAEDTELLRKDARHHLIKVLGGDETGDSVFGSFSHPEAQLMRDLATQAATADKFLDLFGTKARYFNNGHFQNFDSDGVRVVPAGLGEMDSGIIVLGREHIGMLWACEAQAR